MSGKWSFTIHRLSFTINNIMENFFAKFLGPDSIYILLVGLFNFLIGFLTAWLLWRGRAKRYEKEAAQWKKQYDDLVVQHNGLKEEMELKDADLVKAKRESTEAIALAKTLEADKDKWQGDLDAALEESVRAHANASSYQATVEDLNSQIVGLKSINTDLNISMEVGSSGNDSNEMADALERINDLESKLKIVEDEKDVLSVPVDNTELHELKASYQQAATRIEELEAAADELQLANSELQTKLNQQVDFVASKGVELVAEPEEEIYAPAPEKINIDKGESLTLNAVAARDEIKSAIGVTIPAATEADKDDLTKIDGIGSFLEKKIECDGHLYIQASQCIGCRYDRNTHHCY